MITFILVAALAALATGVLIVLPMLRGSGDAPVRETLDAALYRDQLAEVDRDLDRGTINAAEAEGARAEISRRLLAASAKIERGQVISTGPRMSSGLVAGLSLIAVPMVAAGIYLATGAPGARDLPFAERSGAEPAQVQTAAGRPNQVQAEATQPARAAPDTDPEYAELIERLEARIAANPNDTQGLRLLASGLMRLERFGDAWRVNDRLIGLLGAAAEAELYANMAEGMVLAAGGYVSPEAEQALGLALERNPRLHVARYYAGLSLAQNGLIPEAIRVWEELRAEAPPDAPWRPWLDQMLAQATEMRDRGMPNPPGGPDEEAIAAAEAMSPDERMEMIMGMVQGLEERLLTEGGTAEKWNQLLNSYMQLQRVDDAKRVVGLARERLSGGALATVEAEVARLGLTEGGTPGIPDTTALPGPTDQDVAAAAEMAPEDRQAMIRSMVDTLAARLEADGGTAEEWYRLMRSNVVLGEMERALEVYEKSQAELSGQDAGFVREQALVLGVITQ
ncbi:MAG: c-type cytochrome biogenesis protein CcmI [Pseudomonadota bacterium]